MLDGQEKDIKFTITGIKIGDCILNVSLTSDDENYRKTFEIQIIIKND